MENINVENLIYKMNDKQKIKMFYELGKYIFKNIDVSFSSLCRSCMVDAANQLERV